MTSSNGNIILVTGSWWGEISGEFPSQRPVTGSFDVFSGLHLDKRLSKIAWELKIIKQMFFYYVYIYIANIEENIYIENIEASLQVIQVELSSNRFFIEQFYNHHPNHVMLWKWPPPNMGA